MRCCTCTAFVDITETLNESLHGYLLLVLIGTQLLFTAFTTWGESHHTSHGSPQRVAGNLQRTVRHVIDEGWSWLWHNHGAL